MKPKSRSKIRGKRDFLSDVLPFLIGRNPNRIAPAHIAKGFAESALKVRTNLDPVRKLVRQHQSDSAIACVSDSIMKNESRRHRLGESLRVVLDPDRRMFASAGSFFPLHAGLVDETRGMDDGFGRDVWDLVRAYKPEAETLIAALLLPAEAADGLTALGMALTSGLQSQKTTPSKKPWPWVDRGASKLAKQFGAALSGLVCNTSVQDTQRLRSSRISALSRGVSAAAFLGSLRAPEFRSGEAKEWSELAPMFAYGGVPPGRSRNLAVRLACRSFETVVEAQSRCLAGELGERISRVKIPKQTPKGQQLNTLLTLAFPNLSRKVREDAVEELPWADDRRKLGASLARRVYPQASLEQGCRVIGRMIGMAGPERGSGAPRFLLETPILALLVSATSSSEGPLPYSEWLDAVYGQFGIVLGLGERLNSVEVLRPLGFGGSLQRALEENHEILRQRLVRCGLAVEYSDGETEVRSTATDVGEVQ